MPNDETTPLEPSEYDRTHVAEILRGHGTWFGAHVLRLVALADPVQLENLRSVYPAHVELIERYRGLRS